MIDDIIISYNNDYTEENKWFFESCADETKQLATNCNIAYRTITPPDLSAEEIERHIGRAVADSYFLHICTDIRKE